MERDLGACPTGRVRKLCCSLLGADGRCYLGPQGHCPVSWRPAEVPGGCAALSGFLSLTLSPSPGPRSALQVLHKACEVARRHNYFPGGVALLWASYYESCIGSEQSCINEWNAMQDLESTRPDSPALFADK